MVLPIQQDDDQRILKRRLSTLPHPDAVWDTSFEFPAVNEAEPDRVVWHVEALRWINFYRVGRQFTMRPDYLYAPAISDLPAHSITYNSPAPVHPGTSWANVPFIPYGGLVRVGYFRADRVFVGLAWSQGYPEVASSWAAFELNTEFPKSYDLGPTDSRLRRRLFPGRRLFVAFPGRGGSTFNVEDDLSAWQAALQTFYPNPLPHRDADQPPTVIQPPWHRGWPIGRTIGVLCWMWDPGALVGIRWVAVNVTYQGFSPGDGSVRARAKSFRWDLGEVLPADWFEVGLPLGDFYR